MEFTVYSLYHSVNNLVYIGMTGRSLEQRKYEHMRCGNELSNRKISDFVRRYPNSHEWNINPLWTTPIYPECREMEAALIEQFGISAAPMYTLLNEQGGKTRSICAAVAHSIIHGSPILAKPYEHHIHHEYPDVVVYQRWGHTNWVFGYRGRGMTDTTMLWKEVDTEETELEAAMTYVTNHFDYGEVFVDTIPEYDDRFDVTKQKLSNIIMPLKEDPDVARLFDYIDDLKSEIMAAYHVKF